ncbi:MAG: site-specific DNA-methyltransferase, partial [Tumebacillaceae bacterium]
VLDFFAGSGTTAQAVLEMNQQDGGNRRFILIQLPEPTTHAEYPNIADITKERVRRVIANMPEEQREQNGFRVFKLSSSNFETWKGSQVATEDVHALAQQLKLFTDHIKDDRSQLDLFFEILLKSGYPLTAPVNRSHAGDHTFYSIANGALVICLELELSQATVDSMIALQPRQVVCLDAAFHGNDNLKTNTKLLLEEKGIEFRTV